MDLPKRDWCLPNGAAPEAIARLREVASAAIPNEYFALLSITNGGEGPLPCQPCWFQLDSVEYVTETILSGRYEDGFAGFLIFGSNGGGEFIGFDLRKPETSLPVVYVDMIAGPESAKRLASDFNEFVGLLGREQM